MAAFLNK